MNSRPPTDRSIVYSNLLGCISVSYIDNSQSINIYIQDQRFSDMHIFKVSLLKRSGLNLGLVRLKVKAKDMRLRPIYSRSRPRLRPTEIGLEAEA